VLATLGGGLFFWKRTGTDKTPDTIPPEIPSVIHDTEIIAALERARNSVITSPKSGQAWGELGMVFLAHRFYDQSNICFAEGARLDPANPRWPYFIGLHYLQDGTRPAIPYLQTAYALAKEPVYKSAARTRLAEACLDAGELIEAEKLLEEEVSANPQNPRAYHGQAVLAIHRGDYHAAIRYLNQTPNAAMHRQTAATLATCLRQLGNVAEAQRLERASASTIDEPWPDPYIAESSQRQTGFASRLRKASDLQKQGRTGEAAIMIEELVRANPNDQTLVLLGYNLLQLHQHSQAERVLRMALSKNNNHSLAHDYLGLALSMQAEEKSKAGDKAKAMSMLEEALLEFRLAAKLNPAEVTARLHTGLALKSLGKLSEAADEYRAALVVSPDYAGIYLELGDVLLEMNKPGEAIPFLEEAIRLTSPNERADKLLAKAKAK
jgi:tetratricopeptide (TPR) repeat protein